MYSTRVQSLTAQEQVFSQPTITSVNKWQRLLIVTIIIAVAGCEWLWELTGRGPVNIEVPHSHDCGEIIGLIGSRRDNPRDLGGEVEFWMEDEKYVLNKSCLIYIPKGVRHCPLTVTKVDKPLFFLAVSLTNKYVKGGVTEQSSSD